MYKRQGYSLLDEPHATICQKCYEDFKKIFHWKAMSRDHFIHVIKPKIIPVSYTHLTMSHYEFPYHLTKKWNGWEDRRTIDCFVTYTKTIMEEYKDLVTYWLTFNEINTCLLYTS